MKETMQTRETTGVQGLFISFEGSEGCGKSTQLAKLADRMRASGSEVRTLREPGGTPLGEEIRRLVKHPHPGAEPVPEAELLLFAASRAQIVREVIAPALREGTSILCDRFLDSTTVYQGIARALEPGAVDAVNRFAVGGTLPDITIVLDLDPEIALERALDRRRHDREASAVPDRMEGEAPKFYRAVREGYLDLARREPGRIAVVSAGGTPEQVFARVVSAIHKRGYHGV